MWTHHNGELFLLVFVEAVVVFVFKATTAIALEVALEDEIWRDSRCCC